MGLGDIFSAGKDLVKMQQESAKMHKKMQEKKITGESKDGLIKIFMNMAQEFEGVFVHPDFMTKLVDTQDEKLLQKALKEAFEDYSKKMQKEMMSSFSMDDLKNILGK